MSIHKFLITSFALLLALACTGVLATSAHTVLSTRNQRGGPPFPNGIPAITRARDNQNLLSFLDVSRYLHTNGFVGGRTLDGQPPRLQSLQLIDVLHLDKLLSFALPQVPGNEQVYYARLDGPLVVLPNLPLPVLSTLLPSLSNLPALLPHLGNLSSTGILGLLPLLPAARMPDLSHWQSLSLPSSSSLAHTKPAKNNIVLANAYEVFDAHNGNLLAWG